MKKSAARRELNGDCAEVLCGLLGRLLFRVGQLDSWQVYPYIVGVGGTGKSLLLTVVESMFLKGGVAALASAREKEFGLANLSYADLVVGRDVPQKVSQALGEDDMRAMVSGESMLVQRKTKLAVTATWTAPLIMASNHMPDYANTGNNVARRIATFLTRGS